MEQTDFLHAGANSGKLKVDSINFVWIQSKIAMAFQLMRPQNVLYLKNEVMHLNDLLNADSDTIIFGQVDILLFDFY